MLSQLWFGLCGSQNGREGDSPLDLPSKLPPHFRVYTSRDATKELREITGPLTKTS